MTMESVYEKYVAYVKDLHGDLDAICDTGVSEPYRPRLLTLGDFSLMWERWGWQDGLQERWLRRFVAGYQRDVAEMREKLAEALGVLPAERPAASAANDDKAAA